MIPGPSRFTVPEFMKKQYACGKGPVLFGFRPYNRSADGKQRGSFVIIRG